MKKLVLVLGAMICLLASCKEVKTEYSEVLHEDAYVTNAVYTPSRHDTSVGFAPNDGFGFGDEDAFGDAFSTMGDGFSPFGNRNNNAFSSGVDPFTGRQTTRMNVGGVRFTTTEVPEKFAVVFKCQHGQFIITKKAVYEQLKDQVGQVVDVEYREVYRTTYDKDEKTGERVVVEKALVDLDFLRATLK